MKYKLLPLLLLITGWYCGLPSSANADSPVSQWYRCSSPQTGGSLLHGATFGSGLFVAVGDQGLILTSSNARDWTGRNSGNTSALNGVGYGGGTFVGVGASGAIVASNGGEIWDTVHTAANTLNAVTYGNGKFVTVGSAGTILSSTDGRTWSSSNSGTGESLVGVSFGNGVFVAIGYQVFLYSSDGINWSTVPIAGNWGAITFGNGTFVAAGGWRNEKNVCTSTDGVNWSVHAGSSSEMSSITFANGMFLGIGDEGVVMSSTDGFSWSASSVGVDWNGAVEVCYGAGMFLAIGSNNLYGYNTFAISTDGSTWSGVNTGADLHGVASSPAGTFVVVGNRGVILRSTNGSNWTGVNSPVVNDLTCVLFANNLFVAAGNGGTILTSPDGLTWTKRNSGTTADLYSIAYGNGRFVIVGHSKACTSTTGTSWTATNGFGFTVAFGNGIFVTTDSWGNIGRSSNGSSWDWSVQVGSENSFHYNRLVTYGNGTFVLILDDTVSTSSDARNWVSQSGSYPNVALMHTGSSFAGLTEYGMASSNNGSTWAFHPGFSTKPLFGLGHSKGIYVAVGEDGVIYSSAGADRKNLTSYTPTGWAAPVVLTTGSNATATSAIDSTSPTTTDQLFVSYSLTNLGPEGITNPFQAAVYVDDVLKFTTSWTSLQANYYGWVANRSIGSLGAGTHKIKLKIDSANEVLETNENDNEYTKTVFIAPRPEDQVNLTSITPNGWTSPVVVTTGSSASAASALDSTNPTTSHQLFVSWAITNQGPAAITTPFQVAIYVDDVLKSTTSWTSLQANNPGWSLNFPIGALSVGTHDVKLKIDTANAVPETNENDNEFVRTISISQGEDVNLAPYAPTGWSAPLVISTGSNATGSNAVGSAGFEDGDPLYLCWAVLNYGAQQIAYPFSLGIYLDNVLRCTANTLSLGSLDWSYFVNYLLGPISAGPHTIKLRVDSNNEVAETNENDNEFVQTFQVNGTALIAGKGDWIGQLELTAIGPPAIDGAGNVGVRVIANDPSFGPTTAIIQFTGTLANVIARTNSQDPISGGWIKKLSDPVVSGSGALAFVTTLAHNGSTINATNDTGVYVYDGKSLRRAVVEGQPAPTGADFKTPMTFSSFAQIGMNSDGGIALLGKIKGEGVSTTAAFASDQSGELHFLLAKGPNGPRFCPNFTLFAPRPSVSGQTRSLDVFNGHAVSLQIPGKPFAQSIGRVLSTPSGFAESGTYLLKVGDYFPHSNVKITSFRQPIINAKGTVSFYCTVAGLGGCICVVDGNDGYGMVLNNFAAPGKSADSNSSYFAKLSDPVLNNNDRIAFLGTLKADRSSGINATNDTGIWSNALNDDPRSGYWTNGDKQMEFNHSSSIRLVVQEGEAAPGGNGGVFSSFKQLILPDSGGPIFLATLRGVSANQNTGVWAVEADGSLTCIVRTGEQLQFHGTSKTLKSINIFTLAPGSIGQSRSYNPRTGSLVYQAMFTDGSWGIYQVIR